MIFDEIDIKLKEIIDDYDRADSISLKKKQEKYFKKFREKLSITKINRRIKNRLKYKYHKISIKPKDLENINYKKMTLLFIKILTRVLFMKLQPIFIDESKFTLKNENFKTWISKMTSSILE